MYRATLRGFSTDQLRELVDETQTSWETLCRKNNLLFADSTGSAHEDFLDEVEQEWTSRECPGWFAKVDMPTTVNGYRIIPHMPDDPMRYWDYLDFAKLLPQSERMPYSDFDISMCSAWGQVDVNGDWENIPDWEAQREISKRALYDLPYSLDLVKAVQKWTCRRLMDNVMSVNTICEWITRKYASLQPR